MSVSSLQESTSDHPKYGSTTICLGQPMSLLSLPSSVGEGLLSGLCMAPNLSFYPKSHPSMDDDCPTAAQRNLSIQLLSHGL